MTIKILTDSSADIPPQILHDLDISVIPLYVIFGNDVYKDGVDISNQEFYSRLNSGDTYPHTSQPSPADFKKAYEKLSEKADGIVSLHLSSKFSGTLQSALQGRELANTCCPIEILDTESMTIGEGLICMAAARAAKAGSDMKETVQIAKKAIDDIHFLAIFDTLQYLATGGRIGKAKQLLGTLLNIKPLLSMKDGEVIPIGKARSYSKGLEQQYNFIVKSLKEENVEEIAIMYNTNIEGAETLAARIAPLYPREKIIMGEISPILGTHSGPNLTVVCIRSSKLK